MDKFRIWMKLQTFFQLVRKYVTVEPIFFLYVFGFGLSMPTNEALLYRKICLSRFSNQTFICDNLDNSSYKEEENQVQGDTSVFIYYESICFTLPAIFTGIFYGSLRDKLSIKIPILLPLIGQVLSVLNMIFNSAYMDAPYQLILLGTLVSALFGGIITFTMGVFSYVADISDQRSRIIRMGVAEAMMAVGIALAAGISGVLLDRTNFVTVYSTACVVYIMGIILSFVWLKDIRKSPEEGPSETQPTRLRKEICSLDTLKGSVQCVIKPREGKKRQYIFIQLVAVFFLFIGNGTRTLTYLFLRRQPLSWSQTLYGIYMAVGAVTHGICLLVLLPILKKVFKVQDSITAIVALVCSALGEGLFGFCTQTWMVFLVPFVTMFSPASMASIRAIISSMVEKEELGKLFSVVASMESASLLLAITIHNNLYPLTLNFWAGFCFILGAVFVLIPISLLVWLHVDMKRSATYQHFEDDGEEICSDTISPKPLNDGRDLQPLESPPPTTAAAHHIGCINASDTDVHNADAVRILSGLPQTNLEEMGTNGESNA